jgi:hypothetical protein
MGPPLVLDGNAPTLIECSEQQDLESIQIQDAVAAIKNAKSAKQCAF